MVQAPQGAAGDGRQAGFIHAVFPSRRGMSSVRALLDFLAAGYARRDQETG
jgi:hypothetical protein